MQALRALARWEVGSFAGAVLRMDPSGGEPVAARSGRSARPSSVRVVDVVGDESRSYPWASITKLCTAWATLIAVEEGTVSLEDAAGPRESTVAHLLAHASGLGPGPGPPLMAPGRRRIYSNFGYETLGDHVAQRAGMPFGDYLHDAVLGPLGFTGTAPGALDTHGTHDTHAAHAAHGLEGTIGDLVSLGRELLEPRLVSEKTREQAIAVAFSDLGGVLPGFGPHQPCDWGLGPEIRGSKAPHWTGERNDPATFGHFGQAGGFLWVDPVARAALGVLTDRPFGPWATAAWPALADEVLVELDRNDE